MKKKSYEQWNTFLAAEQNISFQSHMQETKERSRLCLSEACAGSRPSLSFGSLVRKQLRFFAWKLWFLQGMILAALCAALLCLYAENVGNWFAASLPEFLCCSSGIVVLSAVPLLQRSACCRMMELEQSTRFSVKGSLASQLIFIGIGDLGMLTILGLFVRQYGLTGSVIFISLVIPFLTTATTCLMLWVRTAPSAFWRRAVLLCILSPLLMLRVIGWYQDFCPNGSLRGWCLYAVFCLGILYHECRKLRTVSYAENML